MRRKLGISLMLGALVPLALVSTAWACGVLATLSLGPSAASHNQTVTVSGRNYSTSAGVSPVVLHLGSRSGKALATTTPDAKGFINTSFSVPANLSPGYYVIVATQYVASGAPKTGTPGRTVLHVTGGAAHSSRNALVVSPWSSAKPMGPAAGAAPVGGASGSPALLPMLLAGALSLVLFTGGSMLAVRRNRTATRLSLGI
jgi:hypothetical protein